VYAANSRSNDPPLGLIATLVALVMFLIAGVAGATMVRVLSPRKIDEQYAWLNGAGLGYLTTLDVAP
jgi:uncharacterized membrane protein